MNGTDRPGRAEHPEHSDRPPSAVERIDRYEDRLQADAEIQKKLDPFERLSPEQIRRYYKVGEADDVPEEPRASGWDAPGVADHPKRPETERIHLTEERRAHILDGDQTGGGHRFGTGHPGKTEFPERWDDEMTVGYVLDTARNPEDVPLLQDNGRWLVYGTWDEVEINTVVWPDGRVWTAFPSEGGSGVVRNPKEGREP